MATPAGSMRFSLEGQTVRIQADGSATMKASLPLRKLVEKHIAGGVKDVQVELRRCLYLDSTFLGTLLYLHRLAGRSPGLIFQLISPSPQCRKLLEQMGVAEVFHIVDKDEQPGRFWVQLAAETEDKDRFQRNVFQAHEQLASLPGKAGEQFQAVVRCMAKEMDSKESK